MRKEVANEQTVRQKGTRTMRAARLICRAGAQGRIARLAVACVDERLVGAAPRRAT